MARALEHNSQLRGWVSYESDAAAAINALTEAGFAIVPVEPTEAMTLIGDGARVACDDATAIYRAMISAAQGDGT